MRTVTATRYVTPLREGGSMPGVGPKLVRVPGAVYAEGEE